VAGEIDLEEPVTVPIPLLIDKEAAPIALQERVEDWPEVMLEGEAVKEEMVGMGTAPVDIS
jgi:hypothetical protein